jgi:signal transduction histidine kinase
MRYWFRGKKGGAIAFVAILVLVAGGLGWVTAAALRLEREQLQARAQAEQDDRLRLALWRLDSLVSPILAREDSRPYDHYSAIHAPAVALQASGKPWPAGTVLEPSPLLVAELPDWMLLHFQADPETGWTSPQVLSPALAQRLQKVALATPLRNVTARRQKLLTDLQGRLSTASLLALVQPEGTRPDLQETALLPGAPGNYNNDRNESQSASGEYANRANIQSQVRQQAQPMPQKYDPSVALDNTVGNGANWLSGGATRVVRGKEVTVTLGPMTALWLTATDGDEQLMVARRVQIGARQLCQGILFDWRRLREVLGQQVSAEFRAPAFHAMHEAPPPRPERTMTALPVEFDPEPTSTETLSAGWTPLRVGLSLAWVAALMGLAAVGLGGWSLLNLSERRIRFVSAVTHELRTPLTTLRLYLDMLATGLVPAAKQDEYLQTLNTEADRLHRLIGNVLDFSRLENQRPRINRAEVKLEDLLDRLRRSWQASCQSAEKELLIDNPLGKELHLFTDVNLVQQVLGNLIDNACKYSRGAEDKRIWLRARRGGSRLVLEVEDRGPGVSFGERRAIFRPFRRGQGVDAAAGGVGLGLALAQRWAQSLGGRLTLQSSAAGSGACFRLELPL